jgi:SAM-dependent methyltransferase
MATRTARATEKAAASELTDLAEAFEAERRLDASFDRDLVHGLTTRVGKGDGMYNGNGQAYLRVGRSALDCIELTLRSVSRKKSELDSILDFPCGFGRVTRWLAAAFPNATLAAMEVNPRAVDFVANAFPAKAYAVDSEWQSVPDDQYDLIWCGSLFTHISREKSERLFAVLAERLRPGGLLVATTHGAFVAEHLRRRTKSYRLSESAVAQLLRGYAGDKYGFGRYDGASDYGISACRPDYFIQAGSAAGLTPHLFLERGWNRHQDVFGFSRPVAS